MKEFFKWLGSVIADKKLGGISSKRVGFFWCLWILSRAVDTPNVNEMVIWAVVGLAFGLAGLTIPDALGKLKFPDKDTTLKK